MSIELTSNLAFVLAAVSIIVELIAVVTFPKLGWDKLRRLPALDACVEAVHICAEKGKILLYEMGWIGPITYASSAPGGVSWTPAILSLVKAMATECAKVGVKMRTINYNPVGVLMARDYIREGYSEGGRLDLYSPDLVSWTGGDYLLGFFYTLDVIGKEKPGAGICIGAHYWGSNVNFVEALVMEDAFSDVGTFGEENISIGSYLSGDPLSTSCLIGEDIIKVGLVACCIIVPILVTFFGVVI